MNYQSRKSLRRRAWLAFTASVAALGIAVHGNVPTYAATLESQLLEHAPKILATLHERNCHRIGVLKFRVHRKGQRPSDSVGTLNTLIAKRLEVALALANPKEAPASVQLVRDASVVAAKTPGASHLSSPGRELLFVQQYPLAWGNEEINVDAFVSGVVEVAEDLRSLRIGILAAIKGQPELVSILPQFIVDTNGAILNELGESFQLRSASEETIVGQDPATAAREVHQNPAANFPLKNKPTVAFRVLYDGQPVTLTFGETEATIPEPQLRQRVTLELERMDQTDTTLGVVLKVNGENTLYRQRMRDLDCAKWVLSGEHRKTVIRGFQKEDNAAEAEAFQVLSREDSRSLEMYYGPDVGTISLVVFQQASKLQPRVPEAVTLDSLEDAPDLLAIAKAQFPAEPPRNAEALKVQLLDDGGQTRGIMAPGENIEQHIQFTRRSWDPEPIMSAVIRYYRPQN